MVEHLRSFEFNGIVFTQGMKIIWDWTSRNSNRPYVKIGKIFKYNDRVFFTDSCNSPSINRSIACYEFSDFLKKLNIRKFNNIII